MRVRRVLETLEHLNGFKNRKIATIDALVIIVIRLLDFCGKGRLPFGAQRR